MSFRSNFRHFDRWMSGEMWTFLREEMKTVTIAIDKESYLRFDLQSPKKWKLELLLLFWLQTEIPSRLPLHHKALGFGKSSSERIHMFPFQLAKIVASSWGANRKSGQMQTMQFWQVGVFFSWFGISQNFFSPTCVGCWVEPAPSPVMSFFGFTMGLTVEDDILDAAGRSFSLESKCNLQFLQTLFKNGRGAEVLNARVTKEKSMKKS